MFSFSSIFPVGTVEAADNGPLRPELANRHHAREGDRVKGRQLGQLAFREAGPDVTEHPRFHYDQGPTRSRDPGSAPRLRVEALPGGGAHRGPRPAARRSVVHRGPWREAWARTVDPGTGAGEGCDLSLDCCSQGS